MSILKLRVMRLSELVPLPTYAHDGDSGLDLCSREEGIVSVGGRRLFKTGIAIEMPSFSEGQIRSRSGLALNHGIAVLNAPGTIDASFRGEIAVLLINHGEKDFKVEIGMRIAQLVVALVVRVTIEEASELPQSSRGIGGFGSTDRTG
jgi:dUTP pyrophosphatase